MEILLGSPDHDTRVLVDGGDVVGFCNLITQSARTWVDDLCIADDSRWPDAMPSLEAVPRPWVTCVAVADGERASALATIDAEPVCTYFSRSLEPTAAAPLASPEVADFEPWPVGHTFAEESFQPTADGALVVTDGTGGYAVGSAGVNPPIYDPGGPSCVVDTIRGDDRHGLLLSAMQQASARGDAQMIVVCEIHDDTLREALLRAGFEPQVNMHART